MVTNTGILDPEYHGRLIETLDDVLRQANVQRQFVINTASNWCTPAEIAWLSSIRDPELSKSGLVLSRRHNPLATMAAMTGALLRNYIDCRVILTRELMEMQPREVTVVAVPNFYLHSSNAGKVAAWESPLVLEWLYARFNADKKCILYVENMDALRAEYGNEIYEFLINNYVCMVG